MRLLPHLASLRLYDNSAENDPKAGKPPRPILLLHLQSGQVVSQVPLDGVPQWAKPIFAAALRP